MNTFIQYAVVAVEGRRVAPLRVTQNIFESSLIQLVACVKCKFIRGEMHAVSDPSALAGMLPFDSIGLYEQPKPRFIFKMPRVVPDQKGKFESDDLFKRLSRESEVCFS